jgi:hypothetical protein
MRLGLEVQVMLWLVGTFEFQSAMVSGWGVVLGV